MGFEKIKGTITSSPSGAVIGAIGGYLLAKAFNYEKEIPVISFVVMGIIVGASLGYEIKSSAS
jgi:ethanolamine transporter EutH